MSSSQDSVISGRPEGRVWNNNYGVGEYRGHQWGRTVELKPAEKKARLQEVRSAYQRGEESFYEGNRDLLERYVEDGLVNYRPGMNSPALFSAVSAGDVQGVRYLLDNGADITIKRGCNNNRALACAIMRHHRSINYQEMIQLLLDYGADPNYKNRNKNKPGFAALHHALFSSPQTDRREGHIGREIIRKVIDILIAAGAEKIDGRDVLINEKPNTNAKEVRVYGRAEDFGVTEKVVSNIEESARYEEATRSAPISQNRVSRYELEQRKIREKARKRRERKETLKDKRERTKTLRRLATEIRKLNGSPVSFTQATWVLEQFKEEFMRGQSNFNETEKEMMLERAINMGWLTGVNTLMGMEGFRCLKNPSRNRTYALHLAIGRELKSRWYYRIIRDLIAGGMDPNAENISGHVPLSRLLLKNVAKNEEEEENRLRLRKVAHLLVEAGATKLDRNTRWGYGANRSEPFKKAVALGIADIIIEEEYLREQQDKLRQEEDRLRQEEERLRQEEERMKREAEAAARALIEFSRKRVAAGEREDSPKRKKLN